MTDKPAKHMEKQFIEEENKWLTYVKRYSNSLVIREVQFTAMVRYLTECWCTDDNLTVAYQPRTGMMGM